MKIYKNTDTGVKKIEKERTVFFETFDDILDFLEIDIDDDLTGGIIEDVKLHNEARMDFIRRDMSIGDRLHHFDTSGIK